MKMVHGWVLKASVFPDKHGSGCLPSITLFVPWFPSSGLRPFVPWLMAVTHSDFSRSQQLSPVMDGETGGGAQ